MGGLDGRHLAWVLVALACVLCSCGESHGPDDASTLGGIGDPCTADEQCAEGICLTEGRCSRSCASGSDCPAAPWSCVSLPGRGTLCDCMARPEGEVACNGLDDDCDAALDETSLMCGETCVDRSRDPANCGGCGVACGGGSACDDGTCACPTDRPDICGTACVNTQEDASNCGACGTICTGDPPAVAACVAGRCALQCPDGTGDCDGDVTNGCEADTSTDAAHCGTCEMACSFAHGTGRCMAGRCSVDSCEPGFGDCDDDGANGCEVDTRTDPRHCSACNLACDPASATGRCSAGICEIVSCAAGFADCDVDADDGCEVDTRVDPANCSMCGRACPGSGRPNTIASCAAAACRVTCVVGFGDCDGDVTNGCETSVDSSPTHCGRCASPCGPGEVCRAGACTTRRFTGVTGASWEMVPAGGGVRYPGYGDYSPAGSNFVFALSGSTTPRFARFDGPSLTWTALGPTTDTFDDGYFAGPAWVGGHLYSIVAGVVARYEIATATWTTPLTGVASSRWSQAAHDDGGHVYVLTSDNRMLTYTIATNSVSYQPSGMPTVLGPRLAWDSASRLLYAAPDISTPSVFSFDPGTGVSVALAPLPASRVVPTFCSDRSGHLYTAGDNAGAEIWQYDVETDRWTALPALLPFSHDANGACTVTDDGYLYVTDTGAFLARLRLL